VHLFLEQSLGLFDLLLLLEPLLSVLGCLCGCFVLLGEFHVLWHSTLVQHGLWLLAALALLSTLEVVIVAAGALPAALGERELVLDLLFAVGQLLLLCLIASMGWIGKNLGTVHVLALVGLNLVLPILIK